MRFFPGAHYCFAILWAWLLVMVCPAQTRGEQVNANTSNTGKYRVIWVTDPVTTATIAWNQESGKPGTVRYGTEDHKRNADAYPHSEKPHRVVDYDGMKNCFARLSGLEADTEYYFCIEDQSGVSRRFKFRTAPAKPEAFTFIAGGDSRNFRDVRIAANQTCEKLRPLFICFVGDMINRDEAAEWQEWLDDWQHVISKDGTIIPLVPHRGNHERRPGTIDSLFDTGPHAYYAFSIGGNLFRYYVLNSEIPAEGAQENWLEKDLAKHSKSTIHLAAGYHKPMRPHVSKKKEGVNPMAWADNFYRHGLDLSIECDSHVMKRTYPLKPDPKGFEGFSIAKSDPKATTYIGEGCWGAPLRAADDAKPWTLDTESFNGFDWIRVSPKEILIKTVKLENTSRIKPVKERSSFENPEGLVLWKAKGGTVVRIKAD